LPISAIDAIGPAFEHSKQQLFKPFRIGQWVRLALVGFLAGELSSGGCSNPVSSFPKRGSSNPFPHTHVPGMHMPAHMAAIALIVAVVFVSVFVLGILFIYLNSMMRFVLFDSIVHKVCHVRRFWSQRHEAGFRYFVWQLLFALVTFTAMAILIGMPALLALSLGWFSNPKQHLAPLILGGVFLAFIFMALSLTVGVITVFTKDFVVPQMALENISAVEGWRRLLAMMKLEKSSYAGYIGMKIVLALAAAVALGIVTAIVVIVLLIPMGSISVAAVLIGKSAGLAWNLYTITLAIVAGCIMLAVLLFVIAFISVPAVVFFPAYSIYFFAARYRNLGAIIYPAPPSLPQAGSLPINPEPIG
jgi:hypothetical protein